MRIVLLIAGLIIGSVLAFGQFGGNAVEVSPDHPAIVTSRASPGRHLGNAVIINPGQPESMVTNETLHLESLKEKFDTTAYLSPYSDIVAVMIFEHQMRMMNLITRAGWEARVTADAPTLRETAREFVDYLFFVDKAPLSARIQGTSGFAEKFAAMGPRDSKGRSLRQFDLERRLMRYPCSYMIYSEAFDNLPAAAKDAIYKRMWEILSGAEKEKKYTRLLPADRQAIVEILRDTRKDLPAYFGKQ